MEQDKRQAQEPDPPMSEEEIQYWLEASAPVYTKDIEMWLAEGKTPLQIAHFLKYQG